MARFAATPLQRWAPCLGLALLLTACAHRQDLKPATAPAPGGRDAAAATEAGPKRSYVVRKGDSLWKIAERPGVLGDPFLWPLLYRANRDAIHDPDLIYARQDLGYHAAPSAGEAEHFRKEAEGTPAFRPHKEPRQVLPMQY